MELRRGRGYNEMKFRCTLMAPYSPLINITLALHPKLSINIGAFAHAYKQKWLNPTSNKSAYKSKLPNRAFPSLLTPSL